MCLCQQQDRASSLAKNSTQTDQPQRKQRGTPRSRWLADQVLIELAQNTLNPSPGGRKTHRNERDSDTEGPYICEKGPHRTKRPQACKEVNGWLRSTVVGMPVFGRRTDPVLRSACSRRVTTMWVNRPLQIS